MITEKLSAERTLADDDFFPSVDEVDTWTAPPRRKLWIVMGVVALIVLSVVVATRYASGPPVVKFQLAPVARGSIDATVSAAGTCNPVVDVQVGSQVSGNIKALYADFNTHVKKGQLVALIDPAPFTAAVEQAQASLRATQAAVTTADANIAKARSERASALANVSSQKAAVVKARSALALAKIENQRQQTLFEDTVIARQDADTAKAAYDQAAASLDASNASLAAAQASAQSAQQQIEVAQAQMRQAQAVEAQSEASLSQARLNLEHTRILAPVDGTVIARRMDVGQTVAASFQAPTIFEIAQDLTKMQVDTNVAEADIGRLKAGQPATFTVDAFPGTVFHGTVVQIRQAPINVQNVITYDAVIAVANPDLKLLPGMTANATVLVDHRDHALSVPNAALRVKLPDPVRVVNAAPDTGTTDVYLPTGDATVRAVPVQLGISDGNVTEILQGDLREGQKVVVGVAAPHPPSAGSPRGRMRF